MSEKVDDSNTLHDESPQRQAHGKDAERLIELDTTVEDRILRKCDWHILPWLFGIWLCAFIDRSNIGNARIDGLTEDLRLTGNKFNIALGMDDGEARECD